MRLILQISGHSKVCNLFHEHDNDNASSNLQYTLHVSLSDISIFLAARSLCMNPLLDK